MSFSESFNRVARATSRAAGHPLTFAAAAGIIVVWAVTGPAFHFSDTWQLVINTGTTVVTFLMVFLIQNTQNRDGAAVQTKLDELIRTSNADDAFMGIEKLTDKELEALHEQCEQMARQSQAALEKTKAERAKRAKGKGSHRLSA
jgi:low affinity Fe/Cu permease